MIILIIWDMFETYLQPTIRPLRNIFQYEIFAVFNDFKKICIVKMENENEIDSWNFDNEIEIGS